MVHSWAFMLLCLQKFQTIQLLKNQLLKLLELSFYLALCWILKVDTKQ